MYNFTLVTHLKGPALIGDVYFFKRAWLCAFLTTRKQESREFSVEHKTKISIECLVGKIYEGGGGGGMNLGTKVSTQLIADKNLSLRRTPTCR